MLIIIKYYIFALFGCTKTDTVSVGGFGITFSRSRSMLSLFPPGDVSVKSTKGLIDELGEFGGTPKARTKKIS